MWGGGGIQVRLDCYPLTTVMCVITCERVCVGGWGYSGGTSRVNIQYRGYNVFNAIAHACIFPLKTRNILCMPDI